MKILDLLPGIRARSTKNQSDQNNRPITLPNWPDCEEDVDYLIYEDSRFIVYIDDDTDLQWETKEDFDKILGQLDEKSRRQYYNVMTRAALVETLPTDGLTRKQEQRFKRLIGEAIVCCFEGEYDNALSALGYAREYRGDRAQEISRYWYLSSSILFALPFAVVAAALWLGRTSVIPVLDVEPFWLAMAICFGALGALLSVMSRTGNLAFSSSSGLRLHRLEALSRIGVGAMSGGVLDLAVLSKLFLSPLSAGEQVHVVMMLAAFAAGASERLAPSIIAQFEKKSSPPGPASGANDQSAAKNDRTAGNNDQTPAKKDGHQSGTPTTPDPGSQHQGGPAR